MDNMIYVTTFNGEKRIVEAANKACARATAADVTAHIKAGGKIESACEDETPDAE